MSFGTWVFSAFVAVTVVGYWLAPRAARPWLLLVASYIFYAWAFPPYALLLAVITIVALAACTAPPAAPAPAAAPTQAPAAAPTEAPAAAAKPDVYKVGLINHLTGNAAAYGQSMKKGTELALDVINGAGGIGGTKVEVIYEDDRLQAAC